METIRCDQCGLKVVDPNGASCFKTNEMVNEIEAHQCRHFIKVQMDGASPYTPAQHVFLFEDDKKKKAMNDTQGLRF